MVPVEKKTRIVLSVLAGGTALVAGRSGPSSREEQLEAEVAELTQALGAGHIWRSKKSAEGRPGPLRTSR